jgi:hypothetical protein
MLVLFSSVSKCYYLPTENAGLLQNSSLKLLAVETDISSYYTKPILQFRTKTEITKNVEV